MGRWDVLVAAGLTGIVRKLGRGGLRGALGDLLEGLMSSGFDADIGARQRCNRLAYAVVMKNTHTAHKPLSLTALRCVCPPAGSAS
jgi:hypothetical protein